MSASIAVFRSLSAATTLRVRVLLSVFTLFIFSFVAVQSASAAGGDGERDTSFNAGGAGANSISQKIVSLPNTTFFQRFTFASYPFRSLRLNAKDNWLIARD